LLAHSLSVVSELQSFPQLADPCLPVPMPLRSPSAQL
jgi:hypothetical protein